MLIEYELTQLQKVRVECMKIAYRHDRKPEDAVVRAKELEMYITGGAEAAEVVAETPSDRQAGPDRPI